MEIKYESWVGWPLIFVALIGLGMIYVGNWKLGIPLNACGIIGCIALDRSKVSK